jgi:hypothetical protein
MDWEISKANLEAWEIRGERRESRRDTGIEVENGSGQALKAAQTLSSITPLPNLLRNLLKSVSL